MVAGHELLQIRQRSGASSALVFLHGFKGDSDETFDRFPGLLGTEEALGSWDIWSLGYNTSLLPGTRGIWSADPDLPILSTLFCTQLKIQPLNSYPNLAIIAHSMGGLIAQRALVDAPDVAQRVRHLFLFGTPSNGLVIASFLTRWLGSFLGEQVHNMGAGNPFIQDLRTNWAKTFEPDPPFQLHVIAGDKDQFVPPESSLTPFERKYWDVVAGDHLSIVKPKNKDSESVRLVVSNLVERQTPVSHSSALRLASEAGAGAPEGMELARKAATSETALSEREVVDAALALERGNHRDQALALLDKYQNLGTDVKGTLAGRIKRLWLQNGNVADAQLALDIYSSALATAREHGDDPQIYFLAINVAFLEFAAFDNRGKAREMARLATEHAKKCEHQDGRDIWTVSTAAEAHVYLGEIDQAIAKYREAAGVKADPWQLASAAQQAENLCAKLDDEKLRQAIHDLFDPKPAVNSIFVSYSHRDREWLDELQLMLKPYRKQQDRLFLWDDTRIQPGSQWLDEIRRELAGSKVAVLLVSAEFLGSDFIASEELPVILEAAASGRMQIFWVLLSPAAYEATALQSYQAAHDISKPLESLSKVDRRQVWKEIAIKIKSAIYS